MLTWLDLLDRAEAAVGDTAVNAVPGTTAIDLDFVPAGVGSPIERSGGNGNDILVGGTGADRLYGNEGYNWFEGFDGDDQLFGGNGQDVLLGGAGRDRLYGNEGFNWLESGDGDDQLFGGNVQDILLASSGDNYVYSNGGDDILVGGAGADRLYGTGGADVIYGDDADSLVLTRPIAPTIEPPPLVNVTTATSMTLAPGVRNVTAVGTAAVTLVGNELANVIKGNTARGERSADPGGSERRGQKVVLLRAGAVQEKDPPPARRGSWPETVHEESSVVVDIGTSTQ